LKKGSILITAMNLSSLSNKDLNIDRMANDAIINKELFKAVLKKLVDKNDTIRYNAFKIINSICETDPVLVYDNWDYFVSLLSSKNTYHLSIAIQIIANLTKVDAENKFEIIFDEFFDLFNDTSVIIANKLAENAGMIAHNKPDLQERITKILLNIDNIQQRDDRKSLIKGYAISSFEKYFEVYSEKGQIIKFTQELTNSDSPSTKKKARAFLEKFL
jgi:hypothetical protein